MSLDSVKMFFQNERNKLIGVGVAVCLITTAIVAPSAYFGGQPKYDGVIKPVAFNTVSATGEHLVDYGNLNVADGEDGWGNEENISYVVTDDALTRGVIETDNAIGFQALNVAQTQAKNISKNEDYELNIMEAQITDSDGKTEYVNPIDTPEEYPLVAPINVYMRVPAPVSIFFKDNLMSNSITGTIWDPTIRNASNLTGIYVDDNSSNLNNKDALSSYYKWAHDSGYVADLIMAYTFFNWMLLDMAANNSEADYPDAPESANNPETSVTEKQFAENVNNMLKNVSKWMGLGSSGITDDMYKKANIIWIAGTGTADPYTRAELKTFNKFLEDQKEVIEQLSDVSATDVTIQLKNEGSSTAWYMPNDVISFDTDKTDEEAGEWNLTAGSTSSSYSPPGESFLATQSRRSHYGVYNGNVSGMSQWGYGYQSINPVDDEWDYMEQPDINEISATNPFGEAPVDGDYPDETPWDFAGEIEDNSMALPVGFTATTDPLVFFTDNDVTFEYDGDANGDKGNDDYKPAGIYKPTGMTPGATKLIFENPTQSPDITWELLLYADLIEAVAVE